jgi:hypothetical protein
LRAVETHGGEWQRGNERGGEQVLSEGSFHGLGF